MLLTEIDHVGLAVHDLDRAIAWYQETFGATVQHRELVDDDGVEEALLAVAESFIQLLMPVRESSPVAEFLSKRGEGIHHVAYRVDDCTDGLDRAKKSGARLIDETPRRGSRGTRVGFIHPQSGFGTLIELVEEPR